MKLGEIKLMALKLMFTDTDVTYDISDMQEYYNNSNTREKLIRMNDSINRALSLYYQRVGLSRGKKVVELDKEPGNSTYYLNSIADIYEQIPDLYSVLKVRISSPFKKTLYNSNFDFDGEEIVFMDLTRYVTATEKENTTIEVFYEKEPKFLITETGEAAKIDQDITFDFDDWGIPNEIQLQLPLFIKGEAYEEDEPQMALYAKNEFLNFLQLVKKPRVVKQQTVRSRKWNK